MTAVKTKCFYEQRLKNHNPKRRIEERSRDQHVVVEQGKFVTVVHASSLRDAQNDGWQVVMDDLNLGKEAIFTNVSEALNYARKYCEDTGHLRFVLNDVELHQVS